MSSVTVTFSGRHADWLREQARKSDRSDPAEYLLAMIEREQERAKAIAELQAEIDKGLTSGPAKPFDFDAFLARKRAEHGG